MDLRLGFNITHLNDLRVCLIRGEVEGKWCVVSSGITKARVVYVMDDVALMEVEDELTRTSYLNLRVSLDSIEAF
jgi:hypothetical protein